MYNIIKEPWDTPQRATPKSCYPCQKELTTSDKFWKKQKIQKQLKTNNPLIAKHSKNKNKKNRKQRNKFHRKKQTVNIFEKKKRKNERKNRTKTTIQKNAANNQYIKKQKIKINKSKKHI